jgi:hypothetical protein
VLIAVRQSVRDILERTPEYRKATTELRRAVAERLVKVSMMAADLLQEDRRLTEQVTQVRDAKPVALATAQAAGASFNPAAAKSAAGVLKATRDAIDFPAFVTSLINGVFQAITGSTLHQLERFADLLDNISAASDSFASTNVGDSEVRGWVMAKLGLFSRGEDGEIAVADGVTLSEHSTMLRETLEATAEEVSAIDDSDLPGTLFPLARRKMGRERQAILGTMVQLGLQRVVVDEGRLHASMDMRVDTTSVAEQASQSRDDFSIGSDVSGSVGAGPWAVSARVSTNFSKVQADQQYSKEEMGLRAGLRSSVDLAFRTEQIPLDRLADQKARVKLDLKALVPANIGGESQLSKDSKLTPAVISAPTPTVAAPPLPNAPGTNPNKPNVPGANANPPGAKANPPGANANPPGAKANPPGANPRPQSSANAGTNTSGAGAQPGVRS